MRTNLKWEIESVSQSCTAQKNLSLISSSFTAYEGVHSRHGANMTTLLFFGQNPGYLRILISQMSGHRHLAMSLITCLIKVIVSTFMILAANYPMSFKYLPSSETREIRRSYSLGILWEA